MKYLLSIFLLLIVITSISAQAIDTVYLDKYSFPVEDRREAATYRVVSTSPVQGHFQVHEFYLSDTLKETGIFSDKDLFSRQGLFTTYYENGKIESEILYEKNSPKGISKFWYPNGQLKELRAYNKTNARVDAFYDSLGGVMVKKGKGTYIMETQEIYPISRLTLVGPVRNGYKNGMFTGYLQDGTIYCKEEYVNDQLVKGVSYKDGKEFRYKTLIDEMFFRRFMEHLRRNMRYPPGARRAGVQGTVYVKLRLNSDYSVRKALVLKSVAEDIDAETVRVMTDTGFKFGPMLRRGQIYNAPVFVSPATFKLN